MGWDVTVISTLADSYLHMSAQTTGGAADLAASRKEAKYSDLPSSYIQGRLSYLPWRQMRQGQFWGGEILLKV